MRMKKIRFLLLTLVALLAGVSAQGKTVYIQPNDWAKEGAVISLWAWGESVDGSWATLTVVEEGIYKAVLDDAITTMHVVRGSVGNSWAEGEKWNESGDIPATDGKLVVMGDIAAGTYTVQDYTEPVAAGYTFDFNEAIATSTTDFAVASNWGHIVDRDTYYDAHMSYSYSSTAGVDGTGTLLGYNQLDYDYGQQSSGRTTYDLIVTPLVSGQVTLAVKLYNNSGSVKFYKVTEEGGVLTRGDEITASYSGDLSQSAFVTATLSVTEETRIGIRIHYAYIDNFTAENATIIPEKAITIASANPTATTGTIYWDQQANGKVLVKYTITVKNTGDVDLTQGTEGYSVSIMNRTTGDIYSTTAVPQNLAVGETSEPFDVLAELETNVWPNSNSYYSMDLRENLKGTVLQRAQSSYNAYQSVFVFRAANSTSTSSILTPESWGTITESTTKSFEILNNGSAPLVIKSIILPEGFTSSDVPEIPTEGLTLEGKASITFSITQDATITGTFSGNLAVEYINYGSEESTPYTLPFSATVIGLNTWTADFNNTQKVIVYPEGSIAQAGITSDYDYNSGNYNYWLTGRTQSSYASEDNMFITPKLHAAAGDKLAYDVKGAYGTSYYAKVYVSADRQNWTQVAYYTQNATEGAEAIGYSNWYTKTVDFAEAGDYYVAFALYGTFKVDNLVGLEKVDVAHDLYIKSVSWPDASIKSGVAQTKPSVDIIPLTTETADAYTVKYIYGDNEVEIASKALTASATSTTSFAASFTPEVETTTTFPGTKVVFEFQDGTKFETETFDLTVTNEPIFHFQNTKYTSRWYEPSSDYTTPYNFGKTNEAGASKTFWILNWGSAPLTVKSIAMPEGFTASVSSMTLPAFDGTQDGLETCQQSFDITFSATEAGTYSGDMVITYVDGTGADATFTLAVSGTMLDQSLWYANFNDEAWPAGSVYQDNVSIYYINTGDYGLMSSSTTKNLFITPKLTAVAGDVLQFDASTRNNYYDGTVKVYIGTDRENFGDAVKEIALSKTDNVSKATYEYSFASAGDYYVAFELSEARVDDIYGLKLAEVAHDLQIASSNIPTEGMQNYNNTASVNVRNFGLATDKVTVTAYINGVAVATSAEAEVAMNHKLNDAGTEVSVTFMPNEAGTFPVYLKVNAGETTIATDPVNVTFAAEEVKTDATADADGFSTSVPLNLSYYNSESVSLYTSSVLESSYGLSTGSKIKSITYKGYKTVDTHTSTLNVWYEWVDATSQSQPASGLYDTSNMTQIVIDQTTTWEKKGSASELEDYITLNFSEPLVYQGKALRIVVRSNSDSWKSVNFEKSTSSTSGLAYYHYHDNYNTFTTNSWSSSVLPVLHLELDASTATLSGKVQTSAGQEIVDAAITLKAENGVQYSGVTDTEGNYSINVIQAGLDFTVTVEADGFLKREFALNMGGESKTNDVVMYKQFGLVGSLPGLSETEDKLFVQSEEDPNIFTLEMNNVAVTAGNGYWYKLRADGAWQGTFEGGLPDGYQLPADGTNFTWDFHTDGIYNYKFTFDWANHTLTFERPYTLAEDATGVVALNWVDVTVEREFKAGWNAVVLPFGIESEEFEAAFGENSEVAVYAGDTNDNGNVTVTFNKQSTEYKKIEAGKPYLIWLEAPVSGLKFTKDITTDLHPVEGTTFDFVGTFEPIQVSAGDYIVVGGELSKAKGGNNLKAFRSYLQLKAGGDARSVNFVIGEGGSSTEISAAEIEGLEIEGAYNLSGQKVQNLKKGLYIINGKKVFVK